MGVGRRSALALRVAVCRFLTGALEAVADKSGLGQAFLGLIVLPIAGNACEHITAVFVAVKDKMDLAIGVALGSSIQVCYTWNAQMHSFSTTQQNALQQFTCSKWSCCLCWCCAQIYVLDGVYLS